MRRRVYTLLIYVIPSLSSFPCFPFINMVCTALNPGEALDEHVNTLLSLGMNPRHGRSRAPNNNLVINILDTPETNILVRIVHCTLLHQYHELYSSYIRFLRLS
jgi:hypothetical protein